MERNLSFTTMGTPELDHRGAIELALELGLGGVDLRCADHLGEIQPGSDEAHLRAVRRDFEQAGLSIPGVLCYHRLDSGSGRWVEAYREHVGLHLRLAAAIGADAIRVWGVRPAEGQRSEELVPGTAGALAEALSRDDSDVGIVMQNHLGFGTARDAVEIARRLGDARFGLVYSPDHALLHEPELGEDLAKQIRSLTHEVYISDLVRGETGHRWVFPGEGEVPLRETVAELDAVGFSGFLSFKWERIWNPELPDARVALPRFVAFVESL